VTVEMLCFRTMIQSEIEIGVEKTQSDPDNNMRAKQAEVVRVDDDAAGGAYDDLYVLY